MALGSQRVLPLSGPLRTGRETFASSGSPETYSVMGLRVSGLPACKSS